MVRVPQADRDAPGGKFLSAFGAPGNATGQLKRPVLGRFLLDFALVVPCRRGGYSAAENRFALSHPEESFVSSL